ncbi:MAG: hypothetical protein U1E56_01355 [Bauldia sp.]
MNANSNDMPTTAAAGATVLAIAAWLIAALAAGAAGVLERPERPPFELLAFIVVPIATGLLAFAASPAFRALVRQVDMRWLIGAHAWRFVGLGFLVGWLQGALPAGFAIPEGLGDIIAAAGAVAIVARPATRPVSRGWLLAWNAFGLLDLVAAIALGVLFAKGPLGLLAGGGATTGPMIAFPVSLIPTFFVPLFILVHLLLFHRLNEAKEPAVTGRTMARAAS